jgi:hypothetical protein
VKRGFTRSIGLFGVCASLGLLFEFSFVLLSIWSCGFRWPVLFFWVLLFLGFVILVLVVGFLKRGRFSGIYVSCRGVSWLGVFGCYVGFVERLVTYVFGGFCSFGTF